MKKMPFGVLLWPKNEENSAKTKKTPWKMDDFVQIENFSNSGEFSHFFVSKSREFSRFRHLNIPPRCKTLHFLSGWVCVKRKVLKRRVAQNGEWMKNTLSWPPLFMSLLFVCLILSCSVCPYIYIPSLCLSNCVILCLSVRPSMYWGRVIYHKTEKNAANDVSNSFLLRYRIRFFR